MAMRRNPKQNKQMVMPITLIFRFLQSEARLRIMLFDNVHMRIEGKLRGFDEFMNLVLDEAEEVHSKSNTRKPLGTALLKGENITAIMAIQ